MPLLAAISSMLVMFPMISNGIVGYYRMYRDGVQAGRSTHSRADAGYPALRSRRGPGHSRSPADVAPASPEPVEGSHIQPEGEQWRAAGDCRPNYNLGLTSITRSQFARPFPGAAMLIQRQVRKSNAQRGDRAAQEQVSRLHRTWPGTRSVERKRWKNAISGKLR